MDACVGSLRHIRRRRDRRERTGRHSRTGRRPGRSSFSAGGEVRHEYEWFANEEWGAEVPDDSGYWLQRYVLHVDARLSRRVRLYGELKSGFEVGRAGGPRPSDEDRLDLHQGFVDLSFGPLTMRVGRQELDQGRGREIRHSWGARFWQTSSALDYNFEAVVQTGPFRERHDPCLGIWSDTGYRIETVPGRPRLGFRADITSGDRDRNDNRLGTFNPLFPRGAYFGLIASAGPSNQMDLHPHVTLNPRGDVVMTAGWLFFWRHRIDDGIYTTSGSLLRSGEGTRSRFVGHSPGVEARWQVTRQLSVTGNASLFTAGPFIQESGPARAIGFLAGWATYRF
jgi:Alginate export